jgi:hypothetical protein
MPIVVFLLSSLVQLTTASFIVAVGGEIDK